MVIMQDALPGLKRFLKPAGMKERALAFVIRFVVAFGMHCGRMSACQAAGAVRSQPRHRAQIGRFLARRFWKKANWNNLLRSQLLARDAQHGEFLFLLDQTLCAHQGQKTQNTFSAGNRKRRPRKGRRYNKYKFARKSCHCFVFGLLLTPSGIRVPFSKSYYTEAYCKTKGLAYRTQTERAAELIRELPLPPGTAVRVLGDTAFDAESIRDACAARDYTWIVPVNPERVLAGKKPRAKVRSLAEGLSADQFQTMRLYAGRGKFVAQRRVSPCRVGPKVKPRTFYVHEERRAVHSVGEVLLVFSTRKLPKRKERVEVQKILMTNDLRLTARQVVELYDLRWQIELFFKELKSTLGFHQYRFREFERVERWVELVLLTFLYLEWYRAVQLARRDLPEVKQKWWRWQRSYGLCLAVRQASEQADLEQIGERLETANGMRRLKRLIRRAVQKEYRSAA
jgi:hypothetical protein